MSTIDTYGEMELPEEKTVIEVVENPVQVVMSAYEVFRKIADKMPEKYFGSGIRTILPKQGAKELYESAVKLFEGKEKLKIDLDTASDILDLLKRKIRMYDYTGLFLSALQNKTDLETLLIYNFPNQFDYLGYEIDSTKKLILDNSNTWNLGERCNGIIINASNGYVDRFADEAEDGIQINLRGIGTMGRNRKGGIQINFNSIAINKYEKRDEIIDTYIGKFNEQSFNMTSSLVDIFHHQHNYEDLVNLMKTFNWKAFEQEIKEFAEDYRKRVFGDKL